MLKRLSIYSILFLGLFCFSCQEEAIDLGEFEYTPEHFDTTTVVGKKIAEIYEKYNSKIIYQWDPEFLGGDAIAYPPYYEKVYPFILFMEEVWFKPYYNDEFLKQNLPREIVLVGGSINYGEDSGDSFGASGLAESQYRICIGDVNSYNPDFGLEDYISYRYTLEKVLHHEFSHILSKLYGVPDDFVAISDGLYLKSTHYSALTLSEALERGFIRTYGASNELEDWATIVEVICTRDKESLFNEYFAQYVANDDGTYSLEYFGISDYEMIVQKYNIIVRFYEDLGIDIQRIGEENEAYRDELIEQLNEEEE